MVIENGEKKTVRISPMLYAGLQNSYQRRLLRDISDEKFASIVNAVCNALDLSSEELFGQSKRRKCAWGRAIAFHLLRKTTPLTLKEIGNLFGGRDHSTVIRGTEVYDDLIEVDKEFKQVVYSVKELL